MTLKVAVAVLGLDGVLAAAAAVVTTAVAECIGNGNIQMDLDCHDDGCGGDGDDDDGHHSHCFYCYYLCCYSFIVVLYVCAIKKKKIDGQTGGLSLSC